MKQININIYLNEEQLKALTTIKDNFNAICVGNPFTLNNTLEMIFNLNGSYKDLDYTLNRFKDYSLMKVKQLKSNKYLAFNHCYQRVEHENNNYF